MAMFEPAIEHVERQPRLGAGLRSAAQQHLIAMRHRFDAEPLLDHGKVLVELAEQRARQTIVVEGDHDLRRIGQELRRCGRLGVDLGQANASAARAALLGAGRLAKS